MLIRNVEPLGPYSRPGPKGAAFFSKRGTPVVCRRGVPDIKYGVVAGTIEQLNPIRAAYPKEVIAGFGACLDKGRRGLVTFADQPLL